MKIHKRITNHFRFHHLKRTYQKAFSRLPENPQAHLQGSPRKTPRHIFKDLPGNPQTMELILREMLSLATTLRQFEITYWCAIPGSDIEEAAILGAARQASTFTDLILISNWSPEGSDTKALIEGLIFEMATTAKQLTSIYALTPQGSSAHNTAREKALRMGVTQSELSHALLKNYLRY